MNSECSDFVFVCHDFCLVYAVCGDVGQLAYSVRIMFVYEDFLFVYRVLCVLLDIQA